MNQTGWGVCIDYRKLNAETRKDHFPLSFIDQMLERLAGHEYYYLIDTPAYNQILIAPEDQEKTNHIHMSVWNICIQTHALWVVQCTCNIPTMYAQYLFRHGGKIPRVVHGRFFHLWRFLLRMPSPSQSSYRSMWRKEFDIELGEMSLYGPTRHYFGACNLQERDCGEQCKSEFDSSSPTS